VARQPAKSNERIATVTIIESTPGTEIPVKELPDVEHVTGMNPEVKRAWVAALRSGEYQQGTGCLRSKDDKFCCLGVLTDLAVRAGIAGPGRLSDGSYRYVFSMGSKVDPSLTVVGVLPHPVVDWAGLSSSDGRLPHSDRALWGLNDQDRYTFAQLADIIEREL
jgi:hypothetical protein